MLTALRHDGTLLSLCDGWSKGELEKEREHSRFFCPDCNNPMYLKLGIKKAWHFAHMHSQSCTESMKNESESHTQGKWLLFEWLGQQQLDPKIEQRVSALNQRPDLLFSANQQKYVIELQHSTIPWNTFMNRQSGYINEGYHVRWIGLTNDTSLPACYVTPFTTVDGFFVSYPPHEHPLTLTSFYLNPFTGTFFQYQPILYLSPAKAFVCTYVNETFSYRSLFHYDDPSSSFTCSVMNYYFFLWSKETAKARRKPSVYRKGKAEKRIACLLYYHHLNHRDFPALARVPIPSQFFMVTPPHLWQSWIILAFIHKRSPGSVFSIQSLQTSFKKELHHFEIRLLPFNKDIMIQRLLTEYLDILAFFGVVKKQGPVSYEILCHLTLQKPMETLRRDDEYILEKVKGYWKENWVPEFKKE
ncbi:hypothetical protein JSY36_09970 [Bacillus sp. H-16]|uniref:competence protein CoiA n=1 Tax=Alteribacter salitolerans TaxID=2912333 RepID=UPI0019665D17|nr:competence protein CoiA family protein [Alteribacter salitolerans]MBM7096082.1 hypothetical protein [Alteribacter salitolerans]